MGKSFEMKHCFIFKHSLILVAIISCVISVSSCNSPSDSNTFLLDTPDTCESNEDNDFVGCWLLEECRFNSVDISGGSGSEKYVRTGFSIGANDEYIGRHTRWYEDSNCSNIKATDTENNPFDFQKGTEFINSNGLLVTPYSFIVPRNAGDITKKTYLYIYNSKLCFPFDSFMHDFSKRYDDNSYDELSREIDFDRCYIRL